jgi:hypothetical protein
MKKTFQNQTQQIVRSTLAFVWFYHGLVPKILLLHADEQQLMRDGAIPEELIPTLIYGFGALEVGLALFSLVFYRTVWPFYITIVMMIGAFGATVVNSPGYLGAAFNPVSLNVLMIALAVIGLMCLKPERSGPTNQSVSE